MKIHPGMRCVLIGTAAMLHPLKPGSEGRAVEYLGRLDGDGEYIPDCWRVEMDGATWLVDRICLRPADITAAQSHDRTVAA